MHNTTALAAWPNALAKQSMWQQIVKQNKEKGNETTERRRANCRAVGWDGGKISESAAAVTCVCATAGAMSE